MGPGKSEQESVAIVGLFSPIQCLPALGFLTQEPAVPPSCGTVAPSELLLQGIPAVVSWRGPSGWAAGLHHILLLLSPGLSHSPRG